jgi:hypothetical protein
MNGFQLEALRVAGVRGLAGVLLALAWKKKAFALNVMLPETVAKPVMDWAVVGGMKASRPS